MSVYGFQHSVCVQLYTQEALQLTSNILSPNYTTQWNTLNEVSMYTI